MSVSLASLSRWFNSSEGFGPVIGSSGLGAKNMDTGSNLLGSGLGLQTPVLVSNSHSSPSAASMEA